MIEGKGVRKHFALLDKIMQHSIFYVNVSIVNPVHHGGNKSGHLEVWICIDTTEWSSANLYCLYEGEWYRYDSEFVWN